jgi:tetratricopeptide (TPR) repeat protein
MNRREHEAPGSDPGSTPSTAAVLHAAGLNHLAAGRHLEVQICCQQALALDPDHTDSMHLMGLLALESRQYDHAVEWLSRAIRRDPRPQYLASLGLTLRQAGRLEDALGVFDKAIQLKPDDAELWRHLGGVLAALDRTTEALISSQHALSLDPRRWEAAYQTAVLLYQSARYEEALTQLDLCNALKPDRAPILSLRARTLRRLKRYDDCLADNLRAHALDPSDPITPNNIGDALSHLGRYDEALEWFERALQLRPDLTEFLDNKGETLAQLHRVDEAIATFERIVLADPSNAKAAWTLADLRLLTGNFEQGWPGREARWEVAAYSPDHPKFSQPKWLGAEPVEGKTILLHVDEGMGDVIQFARYVPMLAARGARIVLVVQAPLCPLLAGLPGVVQCIPLPARELPRFDMHCPIMSLPLALGATLATIPPAAYLPAIPADRVNVWKDRLPPRERPRVGLVWSGNPNHANDRNRSMAFATLLPLFEAKASFVSLQNDVGAGDRAALRARADVIDLTAELTDFVETAALLQNLDLVITVDTSVAHLAASLGRPTWIMLPYGGEWRWLRGRDDSPWYPTVRLFRQDATRDYSPVIARVTAELNEMSSSRE